MSKLSQLFNASRQSIAKQSKKTLNSDDKTPQYQVKPLFFKSGKDTLGADQYVPIHPPSKKKALALPTIIMAHGFACERQFSLPEYAKRFASAGYQVILFDYRGFGSSTGKPRELVSVKNHLEDWSAVVKQVKKRRDVDTERLALWGTSFSGGHVMMTSAKDTDINCIMTLVPHVDGRASALLYPKVLLPKAMALAAQDIARSKVGAPPLRVPVVAKSGVCCLTGKDCYDNYLKHIPEGSSWFNSVPARILALISLYRPIKIANDITCPTQIVMAEQDTLIPNHATKQTAEKIKNSELITLPIGHFGGYELPWLDKVFHHQIGFLNEHMPISH